MKLSSECGTKQGAKGPKHGAGYSAVMRRALRGAPLPLAHRTAQSRLARPPRGNGLS